jgi:hypothetical protein
MRSGLTEHFLEYMLDFKVNKESTYRFTIKNFTDDEVNWEDNGLGTVGTDPVTKHAYVEFTGTEMQTIVDDPAAQSAYIPYIYLVKTTLISKGYDVLIEVTETCTPLNESKKAYYYVVFKALDLKLNLYNVKLGTFKEYNDFALAHELVKNIEDINGNEIFKWETDKWVATDAAKVYGITDAAKLTIEVTKLIFDYDTEESFGDNLYVFKSGTTLDPTGYTTTETGINWWNLGTDLQKDKKAKFFVDLKWDGESLTDNTGEVVVLATANSIHPLHEADGTVKTPVAYKDGWFYATK